MAISLEVGVSHLLAEFFANTFCIFAVLASAGAVAAALFESLSDHADDLFVFIKAYRHYNFSFPVISSMFIREGFIPRLS